jgi:hypothetical protein
LVGLHLLDKKAASAVDVLTKALTDETHEIRMMAAWTLVKIGQAEKGFACLEDLLFNGSQNKSMLHNVLDWMGEPAFPLVKKYLQKKGMPKGKYGTSILGRIGQVQGW